LFSILLFQEEFYQSDKRNSYMEAEGATTAQLFKKGDK
jgi:hypothetical protein